VSHKTLSCPVLIPIDSGHEKGIVLRSAGGGMTAFTVSSTAGKDAFDWSADGKWVLASLGMMLEPNLWIQGSGTQRRERPWRRPHGQELFIDAIGLCL
jgi:hypothetical protein